MLDHDLYTILILFLYILAKFHRYNDREKFVKWVNGDTMVVEIDPGFHVTRTERLRLMRINAPEMRSEKIPYIRKAKHARMVAKKLCPHGSTVQIKTFKHKIDQYARYLAEVEFEGKNCSDYLLEKGVVKEVKR